MKTNLTILVTCATVLLGSCKDTGTSPLEPVSAEPTRLVQGAGFVAGTKVTILADDTLRVGYNQVYVQFADSASGSLLQTMSTTVTPMMYMMTMSHSCPVEQCGSARAVNNSFPCAIVFSMPGNAQEMWKIKVAFVDSIRHVSGTIEVPITVVASSMVNSITAPDSARYLVTMIRMDKPKVGMNACEFLVHRRQSMMMFPAVTDLVLEMTPDMPSMGHGSPGNLNPTATSMGHYKGTVNFTMTGEWRITLAVKRASGTLGTAVFWVTF